MTPEEYNYDLVQKTFEVIRTHPSQWDQGVWAGSMDVDRIPDAMLDKIEDGADAMCGSTACMAGHLLMQTGDYRMKIIDIYRDDQDKVTEYDVEMVRKSGGQMVEFLSEAAAAAGFSLELARVLFHQTETNLTPEHYITWAQDVIDACPNDGSRRWIHPEIYDRKYQPVASMAFARDHWGITPATIEYQTTPCHHCGKSETLSLDQAKYDAWRDGAFVQDVWPDWSAETRELLMTGIHPWCWNMMFPPEGE